MDKDQARTYLEHHGVRPPWSSGQVIARMAGDLVDDGGVDPPPPETGGDDARQHLEWARGNLDAAKAQFQKAQGETSITRARPLISAGIKALGDVGVELDEVGGRLGVPPPDPGGGHEPPPPEPPVARISAVYCTYTGHGRARDGYPGYTDEQVKWGPHHDIPLIAPCAGRVEIYSNGTPLSTLEADPVYQERHYDLFTNWTCWAPDVAVAMALPGIITPLQTMYIAVFWPEEPLVVMGQRIGHLHYGHVQPGIHAGKMAKGTIFARVGDTGIRWEPRIQARAAHVHGCAGAGTQLSPNGDLDGVLALAAQGWDPLTDVGSGGPGPQDYEGGQYCAGRRWSDFVAAGKPRPPMPN